MACPFFGVDAHLEARVRKRSKCGADRTAIVSRRFRVRLGRCDRPTAFPNSQELQRRRTRSFVVCRLGSRSRSHATFSGTKHVKPARLPPTRCHSPVVAALVLVAALAAALAPRSQAQPAQGTPPQQLRAGVEITGSSIKRIDAETALPVQVITREQIQKTGATNVEQLLQTISSVSSSGGLTAASASGATTGGISAISLHGLTRCARWC